MGQRLRHRLDQFITKLAHFRFLEALIAIANVFTALRCSGVRFARSFLP